VLKYLAAAAPYATLMMVLVSLLSGFLTYRLWQRTRYLTTAVQLVQTLQDVEFTRSIRVILGLHEETDAGGVLANEEVSSAAYVVAHAFESLGIMVFHRLLPMYLVDQLVGGYVRASWHRLRPYVTERRATLGPTFCEWFQWLAERMEDEPTREARELRHGAARAHRVWRA